MELALAIKVSDGKIFYDQAIIKDGSSGGLSSGSSLLETLSHHSASVAEPSSENITDKAAINKVESPEQAISPIETIQVELERYIGYLLQCLLMTSLT